MQLISLTDDTEQGNPGCPRQPTTTVPLILYVSSGNGYSNPVSFQDPTIHTLYIHTTIASFQDPTIHTTYIHNIMTIAYITVYI